MKPLRWTPHALESLTEREIARAEVEQTVREPTTVTPGRGGRSVHARSYHDVGLGRDMVLCVVVEDTASETVVVTCYKTSKVTKYLQRGEQ